MSADEAQEYVTVSRPTPDIHVVPLPDSRDVLAEVLRQAAREMLAKATQSEVADWIDAHADTIDAAGRRQVVRDGFHPERDILTGLGADRGQTAARPRP